MKYVMLFTTNQDNGWGELTPEDQQSIMDQVNAWWGKHAAAGTILEGERLQPGSTATTVRLSGGDPVVTDGPFAELKEDIGGYGVIEVPDLDAALALVKTWPPLQVRGDAVELRPVLEM